MCRFFSPFLHALPFRLRGARLAIVAAPFPPLRDAASSERRLAGRLLALRSATPLPVLAFFFPASRSRGGRCARPPASPSSRRYKWRETKRNKGVEAVEGGQERSRPRVATFARSNEVFSILGPWETRMGETAWNRVHQRRARGAQGDAHGCEGFFCGFFSWCLFVFRRLRRPLGVCCVALPPPPRALGVGFAERRRDQRRRDPSWGLGTWPAFP